MGRSSLWRWNGVPIWRFLPIPIRRRRLRRGWRVRDRWRGGKVSYGLGRVLRCGLPGILVSRVAVVVFVVFVVFVVVFSVAGVGFRRYLNRRMIATAATFVLIAFRLRRHPRRGNQPPGESHCCAMPPRRILVFVLRR